MSSTLADRLKLAKSRHRLATTLADKPNGVAATESTLSSTSSNGSTNTSSLSVYERRIQQAAQFSMSSPSPATSKAKAVEPVTTPANASSVTWTGGSPPQQHRWAHRNLHSTLGSQPTASGDSSDADGAAAPVKASLPTSRSTGTLHAATTTPATTAGKGSGAVVGRWRNMHELVGTSASSEKPKPSGTNDDAAARTLVSPPPIKSLLKNRGVRHHAYQYATVASQSSDNGDAFPAAAVAPPPAVVEERAVPAASVPSQQHISPRFSAKESSPTVMERSSVLHQKLASPRFQAAKAVVSEPEDNLIPPVQSFDSMSQGSVGSANSLPMTSSPAVTTARPSYTGGFAGLSQSKSFGGISKPRFGTNFRDRTASPPPVMPTSAEPATSTNSASPVLTSWKQRTAKPDASRKGTPLAVERAETVTTEATSKWDGRAFNNRFEKAVPPVVSPPGRQVTPSAQPDEEIPEIKPSSSLVSDMKARFGGPKSSPAISPAVSAPRYGTVGTSYVPKTATTGRQPGKLGSTPSPVGLRGFVTGVKSPARPSGYTHQSRSSPLDQVASPGRHVKNTAIEESNETRTADTLVESVVADPTVLSHVELPKSLTSESSSRPSNGHRVGNLTTVETNPRSPVFARTHPSSSKNRVASLQHDLGQRKAGAPTAVHKAPVASLAFRSPTTETLSDENVPTPEHDDDDPAEESGIGEKSVWVSPRSSRLRSLDKNRSSDVIPSRSNNSPNRLPKSTNPSVPKTPERIAGPVKSVKQWQSPRSARLQAMSAPTTNEPSEEEANQAVELKPVESRTIETRARSSVSDMKAKLWGSGKNEKLIVAPKAAGSIHKVLAPEPQASVERSIASQKPAAVPAFEKEALLKEDATCAVSTQTPQKIQPSPLRSNNSNFRSPVHSNTRRGPPDVATPHGLEPPQRSSERSSRKVEDELVDRIVPPQRKESPSWATRMLSSVDGITSSLPRTPPRVKDTPAVGTDVNEDAVDPTIGVPDDWPVQDPVSAENVQPIPPDEKLHIAAPRTSTGAPLPIKPVRPFLTPLPPRSTSQNAKHMVDRMPSHGSLDAPSADLNSLLRCPSVGDFQVGANPAGAPSIAEAAAVEAESVGASAAGHLAEPGLSLTEELPVSPAPAATPHEIESSHNTAAHPVPPRYASSANVPPFSPATLARRVAAGFSETIDGPPFETTELVWSDDNDLTGPKEASATEVPMTEVPEPRGSPPLSPRPKQERPWNRDVNTLSPSSWQKRAVPPLEELDRAAPHFQRLERKSETDSTAGEEKKSNDDFALQAPSPSSLMRMAADSIHAIDYEVAVQGLPRRTFSEDDESLLSNGAFGSAIPAVVPPEFETAIAHDKSEPKPASPVFGDPRSFGAAGGEVADPPLRVADRAKAIASWNGGLGVSPSKGDKNDPLKDDVVDALSPIRHQRSDTEGEDMSPRVASRGFALDDWHKDNGRTARGEFESGSDFWTTQMNDDQDWSKCDPGTGSVADDGAAAFFSAPKAQAVLGKPKADSAPRTMKFWRRQPRESMDSSQKSNDPMAESDPFFSTSSVAGFTSVASKSAAFDPFADNVDFTEATEFTEGTDFFGDGSPGAAADADPFSLDPVAFEILEQFAPKATEEDFMHQSSEVFSQRTLPGLAPPSGSGTTQYDVWSYDADTSNHLHEGAAEI